MNDESFRSPVPYGLVEHVHRSKSGKTVMAISLPIELRARLAQAALDLGCSKLALVRTPSASFWSIMRRASGLARSGPWPPRAR